MICATCHTAHTATENLAQCLSTLRPFQKTIWSAIRQHHCNDEGKTYPNKTQYVPALSRHLPEFLFHINRQCFLHELMCLQYTSCHQQKSLCCFQLTQKYLNVKILTFSHLITKSWSWKTNDQTRKKLSNAQLSRRRFVLVSFVQKGCKRKIIEHVISRFTQASSVSFWFFRFGYVCFTFRFLSGYFYVCNFSVGTGH